MAGLSRRAVAFWVDSFVAVMPPLVALQLIGVVVPLDEHFGVVALIVTPGVIAALAYVFGGAGVLENTFGRYLVGIRVRDVGGGRPTAGQALIRSLTLGLWPVEALLVGLTSEKRRLGDRWAKTKVEEYQPSQPPFYRATLAVLIAASGIFVVLGTVPFVNGRMSIARAAQKYVADHEGIDTSRPRTVRVINDAGTVVYKVSDRRGLRLDLERVRGAWTVQRAHEVKPEEIGWWSYSLEYSE